MLGLLSGEFAGYIDSNIGCSMCVHSMLAIICVHVFVYSSLMRSVWKQRFLLAQLLDGIGCLYPKLIILDLYGKKRLLSEELIVFIEPLYYSQQKLIINMVSNQTYIFKLTYIWIPSLISQQHLEKKEKEKKETKKKGIHLQG